MVRAIMIVEMAGRPGKHVKEHLEKHIMVLDKIDDIEIHSVKISEPKEIENSNGLFTCFAEADFETKTFARLSETMFDFMPSSVEVIDPQEVGMQASEATELLNNLSGRLHRYDELAKIAQAKFNEIREELKLTQKLLEEETEKNKGKKEAKKAKNSKKSKEKKTKKK